MKRSLLALFAVLALLIPAAVNAAWVTDPLSWRETYVGGSNGTSIVVRDTLYDVVAAGQADTSWTFSLDRAMVPFRGMAPPGVNTVGSTNISNGNQSDTTTVAWLVFACDSSVAVTPTLTSLTVLFDGRMGPVRALTAATDAGWVKADSALVNGAAGGTLILANETVAVPIRTISPYGSVLRYDTLRARVTSATGVLTSCRLYLRYWRPD